MASLYNLLNLSLLVLSLLCHTVDAFWTQNSHDGTGQLQAPEGLTFRLTGNNEANELPVLSMMSSSRYTSIQPELLRAFHDLQARGAQSSECFNQAAAKLLDQCGTSNSSKGELEEFKSEYGVALGLCELHEAGFTIPESCQGIFNLAHSSKQSTNACLRSLNLKPQSWTSYSNNRKDAHILCEGFRERTERERTLESFKEAFELSKLMTDALAADLKSHDAQLRNQSDFSHRSLQALERKLQDVLEAMNAAKIHHRDLTNSHLSEVRKKVFATNRDLLSAQQVVDSLNENGLAAKQAFISIFEEIMDGAVEIQRQQALSKAAHDAELAQVEQYLRKLAFDAGASITEVVEKVHDHLNTLDLRQAEMISGSHIAASSLRDSLESAQQLVGIMNDAVANNHKAVISIQGSLSSLSSLVNQQQQRMSSFNWQHNVNLMSQLLLPAFQSGWLSMIRGCLGTRWLTEPTALIAAASLLIVVVGTSYSSISEVIDGITRSVAQLASTKSLVLIVPCVCIAVLGLLTLRNRPNIRIGKTWPLRGGNGRRTAHPTRQLTPSQLSMIECPPDPAGFSLRKETSLKRKLQQVTADTRNQHDHTRRNLRGFSLEPEGIDYFSTNGL